MSADKDEFKERLVAAMRSNPEKILVGEVR